MTGLDTILESIRSDGRKVAGSIMEKAEKEREEIISRGRAEADRRREEILRVAGNEAKAAADRVLSRAQREQRRIVLSARQKAINEMIEEAERSLYGLGTEEYFEIIIELASKRAMAQKGEIVLGAKDFERVPGDFVRRLNEKLPQGGELKLADAPSDSVEGGFILIYGGIEENCTFRALFDDRREQLQDLANKLLFSE